MKYFYSITADRKAEYKIKRSLFITHLHYTDSLSEAKKFISRISAENKTASHNCWAFIVGDRAETFHSSDAGEPSGTAGQPILNMLKKYDMTNIVAVVTRHFGGTKLGIRGLIDAYGTAVEMAIKQKSLKKLVKLIHLKIVADYSFAEQLKYEIGKLEAVIEETDYQIKVTFWIAIEFSKKRGLIRYLKELQKLGKIKFEYLNHKSP